MKLFLLKLCGGWWPLHWIAAIALALRLLVAFGSEQIWHPDEVFQVLEQGHRLAFGYGTVPWEYRYGLRSWLLPGLIAGLLSLCRSLGWDDPDIYIPLIQGLTCLVSLVVVYCAYWIGRSQVSEAVGRVSALLCALWHELITVAHKPTPEIFGAYLLLLALTLIVVKGSRLSALLAGICTAAAIALRLQYAPVFLVLLGAAGYSWRWGKLAIALAGGLAVVLAAGALDPHRQAASGPLSRSRPKTALGQHSQNQCSTSTQPGTTQVATTTCIETYRCFFLSSSRQNPSTCPATLVTSSFGATSRRF